MFTHTVTQTYDTGPLRVVAPLVYQADGEVSFEGSFPDGGGYKEIDIAFVKNNVKSLLIVADRDVTLKTNANDGTADNTFALVANKPIIWTEDYPEAIPLAADVAKFYVNNASGANAVLRIAVLSDVTP